MSFSEIIDQFVIQLRETKPLEFVGVVAGIVSVWFSRKEHILVYPTGLINTIIYVYLSFKFHLIGEATVNIYYTIMSLYGWYLWAKRNDQDEHVLHITFSSRKMILQQLAFFAGLYAVLLFSLTYLKNNFFEGVIPWADGFATASAFTGMWLMARKKVESWWWWIATNIASIPLYFVKGLVFTSVYYVVLLAMAVWGLYEWRRRAHA
ncbi:nicotinamide mononucleotide transporter [Nostoc ellipsosporum NOK]|nr:nicotinamide mononucleotide transporter [Nostoc ellipsosporum NOK]